MSTLGFVVDVVVRGSVLGADHTSSPEDVDRVLGVTPAENRGEGQMWRDYGLVDFFWERGPDGTEWRGTHFTVQLHRLGSAGVGVADGPIQERHGPLQDSLRFADLRAALADLGVDMVELMSPNEGYREYWQPDTAVHILAADGEVDRVIAPLPAESAAHMVAGVPADRQHIGHLLQTSDEQRLAWVDRHRPEARDAANWWLRLFLQIEHRMHGGADQRVAAARLYLWAVRRSHLDGAFGAGETAIRVSAFSSSLGFHGYAAELAGVVPTAEQIVRDCLDALPMPLDQARVPCVVSPENLPAMRASRQAKNLIGAAAQHLPDVRDHDLAERLRAWIEVKPGLV
ncbi:hypothetical protein [Actinomadura harenae]|uniref:Uncharacterized protein n=1 Tax=Actinomadura harenae TaxID=2483351 RepID=A0A3M2M0K5_9ACTN|nr:hypothetical protein [Actinomadura harenae]RMI43304.1 hypothetical protein EBO15_16615 [Actinomadura harenae]